jgi:WD40 repeat protein
MRGITTMPSSVSVKSMMRYRPPNGTAGLARSAVSGCDREPTPPASSSVGQETLTLKGHTDSVRRVAFSADGTRLASASLDGTVTAWDTTSGQETLTLNGHTGPVWNVAFSVDGKRLATAGADQTVKVWDVTPRP